MRACLDLSPLCTTSRFRGHGSYALALARALARRRDLWQGLELQVLTGWGPWLQVEPCSTDVVERAARVPGPLLPDAPYYLVKKTLGALRLLVAGARLFHATDPKGNPRVRRGATICTCHDLIPVLLNYPFSPPLLPVSARLHVERLRYRRYDHVIAISEATRQDLLRLCRLPEDRVSVIHHGVDTTRFRSRPIDGERARVARLLGSERPYFFYVGGFDRRKQLPALIEGFARAGALEEALILGGDIRPGQRAALLELARRRGVEQRVLLPGYLPPESLPALYRQATAHVLLSSYEGFGLTVTEAFACGCPVVALATSSIPEIAGDAALLLPDADPERVGEALARVAGDAPLRARLREAGLARTAHFSWDRCAAETMAVYRRLL